MGALAFIVFTSTAQAELPDTRIGNVTLDEFSTGLYGTVVEPIWTSVPKACNRASARKLVKGGQVAARTHLGRKVWVSLDNSEVTICRAKGKTVVVGSSDEYFTFIGSPWRKRGHAVKGGVSAIGDFDSFEFPISVPATVELIGTCYSGYVFRRTVEVAPSVTLYGHDIAEYQGSAGAVDLYLRSYLERSAKSLAQYRQIDEPCPVPADKPTSVPAPVPVPGTTPPATTPAPVYVAPTMVCFFPEAWIIPVMPGYEYVPTGYIWCQVNHDDADPVRVRATSLQTEPSKFEGETSYAYKAPCPGTLSCFRAEYPLSKPGTYHFVVTATTESGQQAVYKGSASVYEGYPSGGYK